MPIHAPHNLYRGVNPHLMSLLQTEGDDDLPAGFHNFHNQFITALTNHLNQRLPRHYRAYTEEGLKLIGSTDESDVFVRRPKPDVTLKTSLSGTASSVMLPTPTWQAALSETIDPLRSLNIVMIRQTQSKKAVAVIEVLSPANKFGGSYHKIYRTRRAEYVYGGLVLLEIDFLHEQEPIVLSHPVYPHDDKSHPYYAALTNPHPSSEKALVYGFNVGEGIPEIVIPLLNNEQVQIPLAQLYDQVFAAGRFDEDVDYAQLPAHFDTYSADDQACIRARMAEIAAEYPEKQN